MLSIRINLVQNQALVTTTRFGFLGHQKALVLLFLNFRQPLPHLPSSSSTATSTTSYSRSPC
jgi:hypothetical protein